MTLAMPDSTNVNNLPVGYRDAAGTYHAYRAYLGYADGNWPTAKALEAMFPDAQLVILTVAGGPAAHGVAHGVRVAPGTDVEPMDLTASEGAHWAAANAGPRPVIYASVEGEDGYGMHDVLRALAALGIPRAAVRLLSAHYGAGPHICGPDSCKLISDEMDGTQWTSMWPVEAGGGPPYIDMSMLADDFFGPAQTETERLVTELGIVRQGMTGEAVKTVQGALLARGRDLGNSGPKKDGLDGVFGLVTEKAVRLAQSTAGFTGAKLDGIVGPQTWPVLLGVALWAAKSSRAHGGLTACSAGNASHRRRWHRCARPGCGCARRLRTGANSTRNRPCRSRGRGSCSRSARRP
jgi:peptidoglycan hydrolase-like protein with peptidoglycan-binding domain